MRKYLIQLLLTERKVENIFSVFLPDFLVPELNVVIRLLHIHKV